jgi:hypothetical protein
VLGTTSIVKYNDGRTVGDNVQSTFRYSEGRRLVFSALTDNAKVGCELWIYGDKGSVQITIEDATFFYEANKKSDAVSTPTYPGADAKTVVERGVLTGASYSTHGEMPYRGPGALVRCVGRMASMRTCMWGSGRRWRVRWRRMRCSRRRGWRFRRCKAGCLYRLEE